jgi:hypothetical protein
MGKELEISSYDPRWPLEFEAERERIAHTLGAIARRIDHNGSTSVPVMDAKAHHRHSDLGATLAAHPLLRRTTRHARLRSCSPC